MMVFQKQALFKKLINLLNKSLLRLRFKPLLEHFFCESWAFDEANSP